MISLSKPESGAPFEAISALIDGELADEHARSVIRRCAREAAWSERWTLWLAAGDALRSPEVVACHRPGFAARMHDALRVEPTYCLTPPLGAERSPWLGMAAAAAISVLGLVLVPLMQPLHPAAPFDRAAFASSAPEGQYPEDREPLLVAAIGRD